jgi:hypothetical protein
MNEKQKIRARQRSTNRSVFLLAAAGVVLVLVAIVIVLSQASQGLMGDAVAVDSRDHVAIDTVPGPYATNPPAGGSHFSSTFKAGFYQESDLQTLPPHPEGYLVHNLEHGYVIFWYNCAAAPSLDCSAIKQTIREVMDKFQGIKLIAFPWDSMKDVPLTLTSWGRIMRLSTADAGLMSQFVERNRYQSPESNAQ